MRIIVTVLFAVTTVLTLVILNSCGAIKEKENIITETDTNEFSSDNDPSGEDTDGSEEQRVMDLILTDVRKRDGVVYVELGSVVTLTDENFTTVILGDKLGLDTNEYVLHLDTEALKILTLPENYGGIGFGQTWLAYIDTYVENVTSGKKSQSETLIYNIKKSEDAEKRFN